MHRVGHAHGLPPQQHGPARVVGQWLREAVGEAEMLPADAGRRVTLQHVHLKFEAAEHRHAMGRQRRLDIGAPGRRLRVRSGVEQQDRVDRRGRIARHGLHDVLGRQRDAVGQHHLGRGRRLGVAAPLRPGFHHGRQPRAEAAVAEPARPVGLEHPPAEGRGEGRQRGPGQAERGQAAAGEGERRRAARAFGAGARHGVGDGRDGAQRAQPRAPGPACLQQQRTTPGQPREAGGDEALRVLRDAGRKRPGRGGRRRRARHSSRNHACASFGLSRVQRSPATMLALRSTRSTVSQG